MCFVQLLKHWFKEQTMQIKCGKHLSEPFHHMSLMGLDKTRGRILSPYLFAVYLDDFFH